MTSNSNQDQPWYQDGLRFFCSRCNRCCRHESGYVFLSEQDISRISQGLGQSRNHVIDKYTKTVNLGLVKRISLLEQDNFDCVFWDKGGCTIYDHRPLQCQAFPFWPQNLDNPGAWEEISEECPGINLGATHSKNAIKQWLKKRTNEPFLEPKP